MTLAELVADAARQLQEANVSFGHGTTNAHDEAAWLVLWCLQLPLDSELGSQPILPAQQAELQALLHERIHSRRPAAYLTRQTWLQGVPFYVDERSIIPRSLIAELLANGSIDDWLSDQTHRVLDLCTGNGSLACLAALAWPQVSVTASDISLDALAVARINLERHCLLSRVSLVQSDAFQHLTGQWDLLLCNPPYVNAQSMANLPPEYQAEPALALAGGVDGMDFIRRLLAQAVKHMTMDAVLLLEIGHERAHFEAAFPRLPVFWQTTSAGSDQVVLITRTALIQYWQSLYTTTSI